MPSIFRHTVLLSLCCATMAHAEGWQNLDAIDAAVAVAPGVNGSAQPVDRRIRLAECAQSLTVDPVAFGAVAVRCASPGWRLRVPIRGGAVLASNDVPVIRRGDPVSVVTGSAGFTVSAAGTADGDGRVGDRVRVKTGPGNASIVGQIVDAGTVRIFAN